MPLKGITPESSQLKGVSLKDYKKTMENKCEGNENKTILGDFNITMDKMNKDSGNETLLMLFQRPRIYTHIKFANNAKTNHIMVSLLI